MSLPKTIKVTQKIIQEIDVINHKSVTYNNKNYIVCYLLFNNDEKLFVIDASKKDEVINKKWHFIKENGYISKCSIIDGQRKELTLHNFLLNKDGYKDQKYVDHINKNGCDNRFENLQELTYTESINLKRILIIPEEKHFDDIPKFITYRKGTMRNGDRFIIEIKLESGNINWQSTSSKNVDTNTKLKHALYTLNEFNKTNLELQELNKKINNIEKKSELIRSFNEIIRLSGYPSDIINKNLMNLAKETKIEEKIDLDTIDPTEYLNEIKETKINHNIDSNKLKEYLNNNKPTFNYKDVTYQEQKYTICYTSFNDEDILFIIDFDEKKHIINKKWHKSSEDYIAHTLYEENDDKKIKREQYLHNYIMNKFTFDGKGQDYTIDHINRIGRDNRIINLRKLSQSHQNINQKKRIRITELPEGCGIDPQDIPTNIYYKKSQGLHGDRFCIEIKNVNPPYKWDSTSSKSINLKTKLQQTILKLEDYKKEHPEYGTLIDNLKNVDIRNNLRKSFNDILQLSGFPQEIINKNLAEFEEEPKDKIDEDSKDLAKQLMEEGYKNISSNLPKDCGVTPAMIPKHCYYKPASDKRSDKFIIERHPKLVEKGVRQWATTEAKTKTTKEKFDLMILKLIELEN